jgi:hypothetical protein
MSWKEWHATEAAILQAQSLLSFRTAGMFEFGFGLSTHPWDQAYVTRGCEAAEEEEMKNELFDFVIQVLYDACPVSQEQGL